MYKNLVPKGVEIQNVTGQSRADLVLCSEGAKPIGREGNVADHVQFVLEVKRGSAQVAEINADLRRLHNFLAAVGYGGPRAFLLVVSEGGAPKSFVKNGKSWLGVHEIPGMHGHFRVRRTVKAAASFSGKESAHYVCLVEVFLAGQKAKEI
tara:strand:- start:326 stop:778 length:453 start_codon:yes stop_codon:yes gene_type:complete